MRYIESLEMHADKIVIRKGDLVKTIILFIAGILLLLLHLEMEHGRPHSHGRFSLLWLALGCFLIALTNAFDYFNPTIIDKDGVRGSGIGKIEWSRIIDLEMARREVPIRGRRGILNSSSTESRWGIVINERSREEFILLPEDRPDMRLLQDLQAIAQVPVEIDERDKLEYDEGVALYLENKAAMKSQGQNSSLKLVDNSITAPIIIGIILLSSLIGLIVWRLIKIL